MTWPEAAVAISAIWAIVVLLSVWIWSTTYVKPDIFDDNKDAVPFKGVKKGKDDDDFDWG